MWCPKGIDFCEAQALEEWAADDWAQAPYQYKLVNKVIDVRTSSRTRRLITSEEERVQQYDEHYTAPLMDKF